MIKKKFRIIAMALCMLMLFSTSVYAEPTDEMQTGDINSELEIDDGVSNNDFESVNVTENSSSEEISIKEDSTKEDDTESENIENTETVENPDTIAVEETNDVEKTVTENSQVDLLENSLPFTITVDKNSGVHRVIAENISRTEEFKSLSCAIWSENNGQDDLKWFDGTYDPETKSGEIDYSITSFKEFGEYNVHVYAVTATGKFCLGGIKYTINKPKADKPIVETDAEKRSFSITINNVVSETGIKNVKAAVWSQENQSDLIWYDAKLQSDGSYVVESDISKHNNNFGTYNIHVYLEDLNNTSSFICYNTMEFKLKLADVKAEQSENDYLINVDGIDIPGTVKKVSFAVWSDDKGQDDLKWFDATATYKDGKIKYLLSMSQFKSYGSYNVHMYVTNTAGQEFFDGYVIFNVNRPSYTKYSASVTDMNAGKFKVVLEGLKSDYGVKQVRVAVWSKSNQSDLVWYYAKKDSTGNYFIESDISKHNNNIGNYNAHAYVDETSGRSVCLASTVCELGIKSGGISLKEISTQTLYDASIKILSVPSGIKSCKVAVWSDANGQDDVKWYTATSTNGVDYTARIDINNHKSSGKYNFHFYVERSNGESTFVSGSTFNVKVTAKFTAEGYGIKTSDGTFKVQVKISDPTIPVKKIEVPVWASSNMSDVTWYEAVKQSDGTYVATVSTPSHGNRIGTYQFHVYATFQNGVRSCLGGSSFKFDPANYLTVTKNAKSQRTISLSGVPSATDVKFYVWSDANGQDDMKLYNAVKQSNGAWTYTVNLINHKDYGNYNVHAYVNGKAVNSKVFNVDKDEVVKNGWYYESGYKFYYINGVKQTDIRNIIGAQSTYRIEVNRVCNTVTVYAKDGANGYIIPVCAFACSVGLPETPTYTGTYTVGAKYRWKMLMGPSWGQYATTVSGQAGVYFHSVAGSNQTSYNLDPNNYNMLGNAASHGCIRLTVRDAKWIYDNVPYGSQIYIYDAISPGPMGKPATIKIPAWQNWDPTDPAV
jgi:lipoprotein-anchoring transpeptidase ErfK/SrfK